MGEQRAGSYDAAAASGDAPGCLCCALPLYRQEVQDGRSVCRLCEAVMAKRLTEVADLWEQLPACTAKGTPGGSNGGGVAVAGGTGSAAPGNIAAISLLAGDVTGRLLAVEDDWRRALDLPVATFRGDPGQALAVVLRFLTGNLYWACRVPAGGGVRPDVQGLHTELRRLVGEMASVVTGERDPRVTVPFPCPAPATGWDPDDEDAPRCGGRLRMDPRVLEISCANDRRHTVPRHRWLELGLTVGSITLGPAREAA